MKREKIYVKCGHADMRRGIDGLAGVVIEELELDVFGDQNPDFFSALVFSQNSDIFFTRQPFPKISHLA